MKYYYMLILCVLFISCGKNKDNTTTVSNIGLIKSSKIKFKVRLDKENMDSAALKLTKSFRNVSIKYYNYDFTVEYSSEPFRGNHLIESCSVLQERKGSTVFEENCELRENETAFFCDAMESKHLKVLAKDTPYSICVRLEGPRGVVGNIYPFVIEESEYDGVLRIHSAVEIDNFDDKQYLGCPTITFPKIDDMKDSYIEKYRKEGFLKKFWPIGLDPY